MDLQFGVFWTVRVVRENFFNFVFLVLRMFFFQHFLKVSKVKTRYGRLSDVTVLRRQLPTWRCLFIPFIPPTFESIKSLNCLNRYQKGLITITTFFSLYVARPWVRFIATKNLRPPVQKRINVYLFLNYCFNDQSLITN